jgi:hypothetical protein
MSWSERYVQDHSKRTDRACNRLASDPPSFAMFQELLICARTRAPRLFEAPVNNGRHLGVDALLHLARFQSAPFAQQLSGRVYRRPGAPQWRPWQTT